MSWTCSSRRTILTISSIRADRRIVCAIRENDVVEKGQRVGMIKFGSRMDVLFGPEWEIVVRPGMHVSGGSSVIARRRDRNQTNVS